MNDKTLLLVLGGVLLLILMNTKKPLISVNQQDLPPIPNSTETDENGDTYWLIRPQGLVEADGSFEAALYAKQGVDQSQTVYLKSLRGDHFIPIPA